MEKKRLLLAGLFLALCILIGYGLYWMFFKKNPTSSNTDQIASETGIEANGTLPNIGSGTIPVGNTNGGRTLEGTVPNKNIRPTTGNTNNQNGLITIGSQSSLVKIATNLPANYAQVSGGNVKFYNAADGKFYRFDANGRPVPLSDTIFYNVEKATWSPTSNESIIEYPDGSNIYYNFDTKKQVSLPKHWESFSFSPQGDRIAAKSIGLDTSNRWLVTTNPDGTAIKLIEPMGENANAVDVTWSPNKQVVALARTGDSSNADSQEVFLVGLNKENFHSLTVAGLGMQTQWSPSGSKLLHSVYNSGNDYKPQLWIVDADPANAGGNRHPLGINTWASKCTMNDERYAYCGVPTSLDTGAGFAPSIADTTPDKLYKIDTATGIKTEIPLTDNYSISSIIVGDGGKTLYFTDKNKTGMFKVAI